MLFSSLEFLFLYLPLVLLVHFIVPFRWRNAVLFIVSLIFYGWGEPAYVFLMLFVVTLDYLAGYWIEKKPRESASRKRILVLTIILDFAILFVFKYLDFLIDTLHWIPAFSSIPYVGLELPIGISFYTFQAVSYVVDVYRGDVDAQKNYIAFGTYVTFFPQLIAGPIVRYKDIEAQLNDRKTSLHDVAEGARIFCCGLMKKVLLANTAGELWERMRDIPVGEQTFIGAWFGIICFGMHIYFDFSGYSDMAIGLGRIFGFRLPENFRYPFTADSMTDFWRRWHITLSSWFREYVYYPLGGNRKSKLRTYLNILIVWCLTGLWHGANWNFVLWGLYFAVLLIMEKAFLLKALEKIPAFLRHIYMLVLLQFSWLIFVFDGSTPTLSASAALRYLKAMLGIGVSFASGADLYELLRNLVVLFVLVLASLPYPARLVRYLRDKYAWTDHVLNILCLLSLVLGTAYLVNSGYNPFLYFRF